MKSATLKAAAKGKKITKLVVFNEDAMAGTWTYALQTNEHGQTRYWDVTEDKDTEEGLTLSAMGRCHWILEIWTEDGKVWSGPAPALSAQVVI